MAPKSDLPKSAADPKEPKKTPTHPPVLKMVTEALKSLNERGGSSLKAIKKFMEENFEDLDMKRLTPHINKCVKKGLDTGTFIQTTGKGINGSFKLPKEAKKAATKGSSEAAEVGEETKKPAGKKPVATATSTTATTSTTVATKKAAPKKPAAARAKKAAMKVKLPTKKTPEKNEDNEGDTTLPIEDSQGSTDDDSDSSEENENGGRLPDIVAPPLSDTKENMVPAYSGQREDQISASDSSDSLEQEEDEEGVIEVRPKAKKAVVRKPAAKKVQPKKPAAKASKGATKKTEVPPSPIELSDDSEEEGEEEAPAAKKPAMAPAKAKKAPPKKKAPAPKKKATAK